MKFLPSLLLLLLSCAPEPDRAPGVCLSFDDRTIDEWYDMMPLLDKYNAHVTFFISQMDSLRPDEVVRLKAMADKGHEIGSHGAMHVNAETFIKEHGYKKYLHDEIDQNIDELKQEGFESVDFAYPYGAKYWFTDFLLLRRFDRVRTVSAIGDMDISLLDEIYYRFDSDDKLSAVGIDVNSGLTPAMVKSAVKRARERKEVLMLYGHVPAMEGDSIYRFDPAFLEFILKECSRNGLRFYRFDQLGKTE
ncbi:polysaccharide deacetylase family protein [Chryseolinea sp. T2]|uniref:polysaccharide deacetylase family protein n=1 Tax=Chryseolinea sp. T2 TaxID=3129255 RepID=UPI0030768BDF